MEEQHGPKKEPQAGGGSAADACRAAAVEKLVSDITNEWRREQADSRASDEERTRFNRD
jgi:hypothetical protein